MGAGRKTSTYDFDTANASPASLEEVKRKLGENGKLGGVVFGCSNETIGECLQNLIFGLPRSHFSYVYWIEPELPIFLFNYNDRKLHGIFRATTYGQLDINPHAWTGSATLKTRFPAQVEVEVWKNCQPIHERDFKPILKNCYYQTSERHSYFVFELTKSEAKGLMNKFEQHPRPAQPAASSPQQQPGSSQKSAQQQSRSSQSSSQTTQTSPAAAATSSPAAAPDEWQVFAKKKPANAASAAPAAPAWSTVVQSSSAARAGSPSQHVASNFAIDVAARHEDLDSPPAGEGAQAQHSKDEHPRAAALIEVKQPDSAAALFTSSLLASAAHGSTDRLTSSSSRPQSRNSNVSFSQLAPRAPSPASASSQALPGTLARNNLDDRPQPKEVLQQTISLPLQQRDIRVQALRAEQEQLKARAANSTGAEHLHYSLKAVQAENEELLLGQAHLAAQIRELQKQMQSMQLAVGKPQTTALGQVNHMGHVDHVGSVGSSNGTSEASSVRASASKGSQSGADELYLVGGNTGEAWLPDVDIFMPPRSWRKGTALPEARGYGALTSIPGSLLYLGGGNGSSWMSSVLRYDLTSSTWSHAPDMSTARGSLAAATLDGKVYAIGGGQPAVSLESTEIWDPAIDTFMAGKSMMQKRFTTAAASLGGCIYACGGYNSSRYLDSMERLDPREGHWCNAASMHQRRGALSVAVVNEQLVAMGGWDGTRALDVVEAYDCRADQWRMLEPLPVPRSYCAAATVNGKVVVAGGMNGPQHVEAMLRLDLVLNRWVDVDVPTAVPSRRSFLAACVVPHHA